GVDEALIAAKHLVNDKTIRIVEGGEVEYFHLLFDAHEIITAAGIPSESYHPAHAAIQHDRETQAEFTRLFPELGLGQSKEWMTARHVARQFEGCLISA
ncbi:MAG: type I secretion protein, partial [Rhodobacteraceae bacterium]|nr:type I secretion protein [Paracoccaceae bacterium]